MLRVSIFLISILVVFACEDGRQGSELPWVKHGKLLVNNESQIIQHEDGTPFLWLGCTAWGMTEWLSREEVDLYLDDRKSKGMNLVQLCLFWGKRVDYPTKFTANPRNFYGHKAFIENDGFPDATQPATVKGGSPENPNDYWDHVDYCIQAIKDRGMYAAVLPFWGRRYVNATHSGHSLEVFTPENIFDYGEFLGKRYGKEPNIIWVNGGDVAADYGGDFLPHYRLLAEGLLKGVTGQNVNWNQESELWDEILMTYHPDGTPMTNSSRWFHNDPWLDFNMIETHIHRNQLVSAIRQDLSKKPVKPTVMGEGHYEGTTGSETAARAIHIRRQAYQTFFSGGAGHTYGGGFDDDGNGPLFSPSNNWKHLLNWEGAGQMIYLKSFLEENKWWTWKPDDELIVNGKGKGELEKLAVKNNELIFIYFPDNSECELRLKESKILSWFNTITGKLTGGIKSDEKILSLPENWEDGILILK